MVQADGVVSDEVQTQLMVLAISDVAALIAAQPAAVAPPVTKTAAKPAASKGKKDEPKPVQVSCLCYMALCCVTVFRVFMNLPAVQA